MAATSLLSLLILRDLLKPRCNCKGELKISLQLYSRKSVFEIKEGGFKIPEKCLRGLCMTPNLCRPSKELSNRQENRLLYSE